MSELVRRTQARRQELLAHPMYVRMKSSADLCAFMEHHVYAVWDFMSLLKWLQARLTCVNVPWTPQGNPKLRQLVNEIVLGEESDDINGRAVSHYEFYIEAMQQCGANTAVVEHFVQAVSQGMTPSQASQAANIPTGASEFLRETWNVLDEGKPHVVAAYFTFGREDLIPDMFGRLVKDLDQQHPGRFTLLSEYFHRHIELDGDEHGDLAREMVREMCGDSTFLWEEATQAAEAALQQRARLWDAVCGELDWK